MIVSFSYMKLAEHSLNKPFLSYLNQVTLALVSELQVLGAFSCNLNHPEVGKIEPFFFFVYSVTAASAIANIVKSSLGPVGLDKMLVDDIGVSKIILRSVRRTCIPVYKRFHLVCFEGLTYTYLFFSMVLRGDRRRNTVKLSIK